MVLQDSSGFYANHFRGTPLLKPTRNVEFFLNVVGFVLVFLCVFGRGQPGAQKVTTTNNSRSIKVNIVLT